MGCLFKAEERNKRGLKEFKRNEYIKTQQNKSMNGLLIELAF